jgi:hypothetical protein
MFRIGMQEDAHLLTEIHANHMKQNCERSKLKISAITTVICTHIELLLRPCATRNVNLFIFYLFGQSSKLLI